MTLHFQTAHYGYIGPDRVDITRYGCDSLMRDGKDAPGVIFAPSPDLVYPVVKHLFPAAEALISTEGSEHVGVELQRSLWAAYKHLFRAEMRVSLGMASTEHGPLEKLAVKRGVRPAHSKWQAWLDRERAVFVCLCTRRIEGAVACHRVLVAECLQKLVAVYEGEAKRGEG